MLCYNKLISAIQRKKAAEITAKLRKIGLLLIKLQLVGHRERTPCFTYSLRRILTNELPD